MDMDVIRDQFTLDLRQSHGGADRAELTMPQSLHGVVRMRQLRDAMLNGPLHLFIVGCGVGGGYRNAAPDTFFDQPDVFIIFRRQGEQTDDSGFKKLQRLVFVSPSNEIDILSATTSRVEIGSFEVNAQ